MTTTTGTTFSITTMERAIRERGFREEVRVGVECEICAARDVITARDDRGWMLTGTLHDDGEYPDPDRWIDIGIVCPACTSKPLTRQPF